MIHGKSSRPILCGALIAIRLLGGCAIGKPVPQTTLYAIEPTAPDIVLSRRRQVLSMGRVRVAPAYAGKSLVFRVDDVRYASDFYSTFLAEPADMLASRVAEWLERTGPFKAVAQPGTRRGSTHVLDAVVTELYGDFRPGRPPEAVMTIQFRLLDLTGARPRPVLQQTIGRRVRLREESPEALVRGYGDALGQILAELAGALASAH
jgi:cholesterol transport system auxiliary component